MLRQLCNATYFMLADGCDEKGLRRLDRILDAPLYPPELPAGTPRRRRAHPDAAAAELLAMMRG